MKISVDDLCAEVKNYFCAEKKIGKLQIRGGEVVSLSLADGQYFRIVGSAFNDGIYQFPCFELIDEEFDGAVWALKIPPAFLELKSEISAYSEKYGEVSPYVSESFGGYSYTRANRSNGAPAAWTTVFAERLNRWRKI